MKTDVVGVKSGQQLSTLNVRDINNMSAVEDLEIGEATRKSLTKIKAEQQKGVLLDMRNFLVTCAEYLQQHLPLSNTILLDLQCLQPQARSEGESERSITRLAKNLQQVVSDDEISAITDQWKLYAVDDIPAEWYCAKKQPCRIDEYWAKVLGMKNVFGHLKYATLGKAVMACLALSHGNADAERSFSTNKKIVSTERATLCEGTINAVRIVKDALHHAGGRAINVPITPALLRSAKSAHTKFNQYQEEKRKCEQMKREQKLKEKQRVLEEEKKKKEEEKRKELKRKDIDKLKKEYADISTSEKEQRNILRGSVSLLAEAEGKLADAIKAGNMEMISVAHGLLEVARGRRMLQLASSLH